MTRSIGGYAIARNRDILDWKQLASFWLIEQGPTTVLLREKDRVRSAFAKTCFYVLDNPRQDGLVAHPQDWRHLGAVVPGYPFLHPLAEDFWELFWKFYEQHREPTPTNPPRAE